MEERKEGGGLTAPKTRSRRTKNAIGMEKLRDFFFAAGMKKRMETARQNLQPEQLWKLKQEPALITDPNSDFDEEVLHSFNCELEIDTLGERRRVICEKTCTDRVVLWKVICEYDVKIRG
ncbi:hypothetical protein TNCV_3500081 [Trichonephila clavipes]|nr:hypothetical protein TNCV_3500081 [Trichonephila clavipes]